MNPIARSGDGLAIANKSVWEGKILLDSWRAGTAARIDVLEKATQAPLATVGQASMEDVAQAAAVARRAQATWGETPAPTRGDLLRRFVVEVERHADEIKDWIVRETGSIRPKADFEVAATIRDTLEAAVLCSQPLGHLMPTQDPRMSIVRRVPIGTVGVITPWNSPFILAARAVAPALAAGNAVLLKPDAQTPVSGGVLLALLFEKAGLPPGVLQVLPGGAETGEAIVSHPEVGMIAFTGSTAVGRRIGETAGRMLKRVSLELGGNNAYIVLDDADIERAVHAGSFGSFFHQGQICMTAGRHLVHASVAERYLQRLTEQARQLRMGDPFKEQVHLGPLINEKQVARVEQIVAQSLSKGAVLVTGGRREGLFYQPTVLSNVSRATPAFTEEIFGPVAPVTVFQNEEEAIELANRTEYGLVASIQTGSLDRGMRLARRLRCGMVHINDQTVNHEATGLIGGMGASGNGSRFGTATNLEEFSVWQWVTVREQIPDYPF